MEAALRFLLALGICVILVQSTAVVQDEQYEDYGNQENCTEGVGSCECCDTDECEKVNCGLHAIRISTCGNYSCKCIKGFSSEAPFCNYTENNCKDIDECITSPCDQTAKCENYPGKYQCICPTGQFEYNDAVHGGKNAVKCKAISIPIPSRNNCSNGQIFLCNFTTQLRSLYSSSLSRHTSGKGEELLKGLLALLDDLISKMETMSKEQRHHVASEMMKLVEDFLRHLAFILPSGLSTMSSKATELAMEIRGAGSQNWSPAQLLQSKTQMELNWEAASKGEEAFNMVGLLTYQGLESVLFDADIEGKEWEQFEKSPQWAQMVGKPSYKVLSLVTAAFVGHNETELLTSPVNITFNHEQPSKESKVICAFWKPVNNGGLWSEEGCTRLNSSTATSTHCQCTHLTSFAVLMAFYDVENWGLDVITKIGLVISLVCLFFSILTFLFCRTIRGIRTTIHLHLCLALFAAYVIFLLGAGNHSNMTACAIVAGLLHYFFLSVFCWMLLEGVELYLMVVQVFKTHSLKHRHIYLAGYGLPAIVVGISAAINSKGYGSKECWLERNDGFLWSFLGPVSFIIMVNAIVFVVTVWRLTEKFADINPDMSKLKKQRVLTITAIAQLCILGTTWIFGMFQFSDHTLVMSYIFTILNSLQGLFIFLLHCLLKKQVRDDYARWFCRDKPNKSHSSDKYSDFSSTTGSNTLRAQKSFRESGI
ncbi:adhesion G protein-coupled receptor E5 isoform X2 [Sceloporus undulatus]|uniref:adhesion G protein-coupled receptor E5 isoform X2 n=1 Tax=Sceloporus undulatus TaxID=8520 RepID=UPI001C4C1885|nr:adhesion G protein-coupled receptor E5 isoform X2 [Sceloporus undulatus]